MPRPSMNLLLWTGNATRAHLPILRMLKETGFEGAELPVMAGDLEECRALGGELAALGLGVTACTVRGPGDDPIAPDAAVRGRGTAANKRAVDCARALGASLLVGPFHSAIGVFSGAPPTASEWERGVRSMREVAEHARRQGVTLALEYLNRFESYLVTSTAEMVRFVEEVGHPSCRMMLDTFHMNIEEKDVGAAITAAREHLVHMQIAENDRGTPGSGHVPWDAVFRALEAIGYDGWLVAEAFGLALPELAAATRIWRRTFASEEQLSRDALQFLKARIRS